MAALDPASIRLEKRNTPLVDGYAGRTRVWLLRGYSAACCATVGSVPATVARRMSRGCDWS
jgi:hypothetical protein